MKTLGELNKYFASEKAKNAGEYCDRISDLVNQWSSLMIEEMINDPECKLTKVGKNNIYVLEMFIEMAYSYHASLPGQWSTFVIEDVCTDVIPRKLIAGKETFAQLPRLLKQMFLWGKLRGYFNPATVDEWLQELDNCKMDICDNAANPHHWGMAKSLMSGRFF